MKFILEFKSYRPTYEVGDTVLIEYWYLSDPDCPTYLHKEFPFTPVKITEKVSRSSFRITHNVPNSKIKNAPDETIKAKEIITRCH
jgi:hypothetical protein